MVGQLQSLGQIVADYQAGKYSYNQAFNMLVIGIGLTEADAERLLNHIDGNRFVIRALKEENGRQYYLIDCITLKNLYSTRIEKGWFEKGYMQNLEVVNG